MYIASPSQNYRVQFQKPDRGAHVALPTLEGALNEVKPSLGLRRVKTLRPGWASFLSVRLLVES